MKKQEIEILKRSLPPDGMARFKRNKEPGQDADSNNRCSQNELLREDKASRV